jgi:hypothetical protein
MRRFSAVFKCEQELWQPMLRVLLVTLLVFQCRGSWLWGDEPAKPTEAGGEAARRSCLELLKKLPYRVAIDVSKRKGVVPHNGLIGSTGNDPLWPLAVDSTGRLRVVACFRGSMGPPYSAIEDYRELLKHFGWRDLKPLMGEP